MKIKIIVSSIVITLIGIGYLIAYAAIWDLPGFAWIGNNLTEGKEQGDPVIGMISTKGENYGISVEGEGEQRNLVGSAWIGIGSQDDRYNDFSSQGDLPSIGWIHFNQSFDQSRLSSLIAGNCFGAGDCYGVRWNQKPGTTNNFEGYLSGWARMEIGPNGDASAYPDIWVHFKSPGDLNNYNCNEGDHNYFVCADSSGKLEGYAWSAGADSTSVDGNPGLGWISFSKKNIGFGVVPARSKFCATLLANESSGVGCKNDSGFTGDFKFKAYQSGFTAPNYQWDCNGGKAAGGTNGDTVICNYTDAGNHTPTLTINGEACANQTTVKVASQPSCNILVRKAGTGNEEFDKNASITQGGLAEAKINRQCLEGGEVSWTVNGGEKTSENGDSIVVSTTGTSGVTVSAKIEKDNKTYSCGSASVEITETVKWR